MRLILIVLLGLLTLSLTACPKGDNGEDNVVNDQEGMRKPDYGGENTTPPAEAAAPVASLVATPTTGPSPLVVAFDASGSSDPSGTIVKYEFDPEGTGTWTDNGNNALFSFTYNTNGTFMAMVKVTSDSGASNTSSVTISVGGEGTPPAEGTTPPTEGGETPPAEGGETPPPTEGGN